MKLHGLILTVCLAGIIAGGFSPVQGYAINPEHVVLIDIDGCARRAMYGLLTTSPDSIPNISRLVFGDSGRGQYAAVEFATTVFPSYTFACQASIVTGCYPATHGIPGNEVFDRDLVQRWGFSGGSVIDMDDVTWTYELDFIFDDQSDWNPCGWVMDEIHNPSHPGYGGYANRTLLVETLFDQASAHGFSSLVSFLMYSSADHHEDPLIEWLRPTDYDMCIYQLGQASEYDIASMDALLDALDLYTEYPDIIFAYLPGHDHYNHANDGAQRWYLRTHVDEQVGRLVDKTRELGIYDDTVFLFLSDHGQSDVIEDDEHSVIMENELESAIESYGPWWGHFDVYSYWDWFTGGDFSAYVGQIGGMSNIYLRNLDTNNWSDYPIFDDVMAVAEAIDTYWPGSGDGELVGRKFELILVRDSAGGGDGWHSPYQVYQGRYEPTVDLGEYLDDHPELVYADAVFMVQQQNSLRSGDILLLGEYPEGYYCDFQIENTHGHLWYSDMHTPMIFCGKPLEGMEMFVPSANVTDIAPTVAELLGFPFRNGEGYSLLGDIEYSENGGLYTP